MPTLFKFLGILGLIGGLCLAGMAALAYLVEPEPREMSVSVPPAKLGIR